MVSETTLRSGKITRPGNWGTWALGLTLALLVHASVTRGPLLHRSSVVVELTPGFDLMTLSPWPEFAGAP